MKKYKHLVFILTILFTLAFPSYTLAKTYKVYAHYTANNLNIISYSKSWNDEKLKELYIELLNNLHGEEFEYLSHIYIYPDSPHGVNGHYVEDVILEKNTYKYGINSYIEIFNGDKLNTIKKIAPILSHEYGHHYVTFNLLKTENIYNNLEDSNYAKIRNFKDYSIFYNTNKKDYQYNFDAYEILADDYVQLLGSSSAKISEDFKSVDELLKENLQEPSIFEGFNLKPQLNPLLPLASQVEGLYNYLLNIGGFTHLEPFLSKVPVLGKIEVFKTLNNELSYKIKWSAAEGYESFEYTLVMYHESNPFSPIPLKTVSSKEPLEAIFGSYSIKNKNKISSISKNITGEMMLKVYIKDTYGFIYSSEPIKYNFNNSSKDLITTEVKTEETTVAKPTSNNKITKKNNTSKTNTAKTVVIGPKEDMKNSILNKLKK